MPLLSQVDKEGILKWCCRYPYTARKYQELFGFLFIFSAFLSFIYFLSFEILGSSNMFALSAPEAVINPYVQNRTAIYKAVLIQSPTPTYCKMGTPRYISDAVYPEGLELLSSLNTASECEKNMDASTATLGETIEGGNFFIRTMRVTYDVMAKSYSSQFTLHPEKMSIGFKHAEVSKTWPDGVSTCKANTPTIFENGKIQWSTISELFGDSGLVLDLLDKSNNDAFAGTANDGAASELPTYRQTGTIFVMAIEYFNYPRSLSEIGYLFSSGNLRASVSIKHVPGVIGRKSPKQVFKDGVLTHIIYDYGIKLKFIPKGSVGTLTFSRFISCIIRSFALLYFAGLTLDFLTKPWVQFDPVTGEDISLGGKRKMKRSKSRKKKEGAMDGGSSSKSVELAFAPSATSDKTLYDNSIYQIPYVRGLYDDSGHDIERAVRNRTRKAFGLVQDLQIDSQALAPSNIPTSRNSASHFDIGRSNNNTTNGGSDGVQGRNSIAQTIDNPNDLGLDIDQTQSLRRAMEKIDRLEGALNELKASHNDIQKKVNLGGGHRRRSSMQRNSVTSPPKK